MAVEGSDRDVAVDGPDGDTTEKECKRDAAPKNMAVERPDGDTAVEGCAEDMNLLDGDMTVEGDITVE